MKSRDHNSLSLIRDNIHLGNDNNNRSGHKSCNCSINTIYIRYKKGTLWSF